MPYRTRSIENPGVSARPDYWRTAHNQGRDKLTLIVSPGIAPPRCMARAARRRGQRARPAKALLRSIGESARRCPRLTAATACSCIYGSRRRPMRSQDAGIVELARAGHPVVRIDLSDIYDLGQEFFRWEIATAVAGAVRRRSPVRPARRGSKQRGRAPVDRRIRAHRTAAAGVADHRGTRPQAVCGREQCRGAQSCGARPFARRLLEGAHRPYRGGRLYFSPCSVTSP